MIDSNLKKNHKTQKNPNQQNNYNSNLKNQQL